MAAKLEVLAAGPEIRDWRPARRRKIGQTIGQTEGKPPGAMNDDSGSSLYLLESTVAEVKQLTAALSASQGQATSSQHQAELLAQTASRLTRRLVGLVKLVEHVRHFAYHDDLTGLPNRTLLLDRLRQAMALALRQKKRVGLLMIDLDGFKQVNDAYGHGVGDNLLQHVAWLLRTCTRRSDTICRYGGDEFVIMLPEIEESNCTAVVQKIKARLAASFAVEGCLIPVTASIGVAMFPDDGLDFDALIKCADILMYREKVRSRSVNTPNEGEFHELGPHSRQLETSHRQGEGAMGQTDR